MLTLGDLTHRQRAMATDLFSAAYRKAELPDLAKPEIWSRFVQCNMGQRDFMARVRQDDVWTAWWAVEWWLDAVAKYRKDPQSLRDFVAKMRESDPKR